MSDKLMDTEPGGESTQYESIKTVDKPTAKLGGQMGKPETTSAKTTETASDKKEQGERVADNIRYGQNISESGQGGMTTTSTGTANASGHGAVKDSSEATSTTNDARKAAGYGGKDDMDKTVGG